MLPLPVKRHRITSTPSRQAENDIGVALCAALGPPWMIVDARVDDQKIRAVRRRVHPDILLMRCGVATAAVEIEQLPGEQD